MNTTFLARRIRQLAINGEESMVEALASAQEHLNPDEYHALLAELKEWR